MIELHNVALAPNCDSNLISLGQLRESGISYHDNPSAMTLMRVGEIIAHAKKNHNLFILNTAMPGQVMSAISRAMTTTGQGQPTHLVSQNKRIRLWHRRLAHASNAQVVKASKLVNGVNLSLAKDYNPAEVLVDLEDSDIEDFGEDSQPESKSTQHLIKPANIDLGLAAHQLRTADIANDSEVLDKLCTPCVGSKSTRIVRRNKNMCPTTSKLKQVHADLWGPNDPPSQSQSTYAVILMCEHTQKTWTLYLRGKDDFVDAFQIWLPRVEAESAYLMKALRADGGGEFISTKLRLFCEKRGIVIKYAAPYVYEENRLAKRG